MDEYHTRAGGDVNKKSLSAYDFNLLSGLGAKQSLNSIFALLGRAFGNSSHLWMWDYARLDCELEKCGFLDITEFKQGVAKLHISCTRVRFSIFSFNRKLWLVHSGL